MSDKPISNTIFVYLQIPLGVEIARLYLLKEMSCSSFLDNMSVNELFFVFSRANSVVFLFIFCDRLRIYDYAWLTFA